MLLIVASIRRVLTKILSKNIYTSTNLRTRYSPPTLRRQTHRNGIHRVHKICRKRHAKV